MFQLHYRGITLLIISRRVYSRVLERRLQPIVEPRIQDEQRSFCPGHGTVDQSFILAEFVHPVYMCFVHLKEAYDNVSRGILWGLLREYGVPELLL